MHPLVLLIATGRTRGRLAASQMPGIAAIGLIALHIRLHGLWRMSFTVCPSLVISRAQ